MKRFKYSLQKLLNMRLRLEKEASQQFIDIGTKIKVINENIDHLNDLFNKNAFATCTTKVDELIKNNYLKYIENAILSNEKEREKATKIYEEKLENYNKTKKDRMVIEKLKDKEYSKYLKVQEKEEQDFLDELSLNMYYKNFKEDEEENDESNEFQYDFN